MDGMFNSDGSNVSCVRFQTMTDGSSILTRGIFDELCKTVSSRSKYYKRPKEKSYGAFSRTSRTHNTTNDTRSVSSQTEKYRVLTGQLFEKIRETWRESGELVGERIGST
jgi:hypothetical protein